MPIILAAPTLLWPALWNGYPIVFADTGTYLSQAIHLFAGWDRSVFYSLFMLPLHARLTVWPIVAAQALLASWVLRVVCRVLVPRLSGLAFVGLVVGLAVCSWLPWITSELLPDLFTPLLVLVLCLLAWTPELLSRVNRALLVLLAAFMIATQQSSLPLACALLLVLGAMRCAGRLAPLFGNDRSAPRVTGPRLVMTGKAQEFRDRGWLLLLPPALAVLALCTANLAAYGRFAISPFGNVFLLARVIYDGPGMDVLRRDCPATRWRLCPFLDRFPTNSDDFLWRSDSPLRLAGGPKAVSVDAAAIITAALLAEPATEARAALANTWEQLTRFDSGDGLNPWPEQVSPWIEQDFPAREAASYAAARQQSGSLSVPAWLGLTHRIVALGGVIACVILLPVATARRAPCAGYLLAVLIALPIGAAITGSLSAPHDRYQARLMWLPPFIAVVSSVSLRRRPA